jgi:hypothetical protein
MEVRFKRTCRAKTALTGEDCRQAPLRDRDFCFWHDPENEEAAAEARRLGSQRAKREGTVAAAMQIDGIGTMAELQRVLTVVLFESLALQNGVQRNRLLVSLVSAAQELIKDGEIEKRVEALESVLGDKLKELRR